MSSVDEGNYHQTMVWIGMYYIPIASFCCILPMIADLFNGFRKRKFWFPCKYFSAQNSLSIIAMSVLMKLPMMDLYTPLPTKSEAEVAKLGSIATMAFMSTMVAHILPSLGYMDNKTLVENVICFTMAITAVIVDTCVDINSGVISHVNITYTLMAMLVFLLIILISAAIAIPSLKETLQAQYRATSQRVLNDERPEDRFNVAKLRECVEIHYILAEVCDPQFGLASSALSSASGVICLIGLVTYIHVAVEVLIIDHQTMWSTVTIRSTGIVVGSIAPICRSFTTTNKCKTSAVFKVEEYWTRKLYEWKESHVTFLLSGRTRNVVCQLRNKILSIWIGIQKGIVVTCNISGLVPIPVLVGICVVYCSYFFMSL